MSGIGAPGSRGYDNSYPEGEKLPQNKRSRADEDQNLISSEPVSHSHVDTTLFPPVSWNTRDSRIQKLIDDSFRTRVVPLHQEMFKGELANYVYTGSEDYTFSDPNGSATGISALKIAEVYAQKKSFSVLDLGTGNGKFLQSVKNKFSNVEVVGMSAADFRNTSYDRHEFVIPDEDYVVGNIENLSQIPQLKDRKFDMIVSAITFRHLSDPIGVLCQAYEMLTPGGILMVDDFDLYGVTGIGYANLFEGHDVKVMPEEHAPPMFQKAVGVDYAFRMPFKKPDSTIIKKQKEHLELPVTYDVEKSTQADKNNQAHIFYKTLLPPAKIDEL